MSTIVRVTRSELQKRRQELLDRLHTTLPEMTARIEAYTATPDEWEAWEELREIAFLLGDR